MSTTVCCIQDCNPSELAEAENSPEQRVRSHTISLVRLVLPTAAPPWPGPTGELPVESESGRKSGRHGISIYPQPINPTGPGVQGKDIERNAGQSCQ